MAKKYTNKSKLLGKIGEENYRVSDCPFHLPKENVKFFKALQDAGNQDPFSPSVYNNQITPDWMKSVYESVMSAVSKEVKKALNEGAWGYEPDLNDYVLDDRYEMNLEMCEYVYDFCKKNLKSTNTAWNNIGNIEWFFELMPYIHDVSEDNMKDPYWKYYMWWTLLKKKHKDIVNLYKESLELCENDNDWLNDWSKPEKMKASLKKCHKTLEKLEKYKLKYLDKEKERIEAQNSNKLAEATLDTDEDEVAESVGFNFEGGFMFEGECGGCGSGDCCGGVSGPAYNTPMNTLGVGNVIPAGVAMTGAEQASDKLNGSGDRALGAKQSKKKEKKLKTYFPIATKK